MTFETTRLILRHFKESDANDVYEYAKDPDVGPVAGWPVHQDVGESLNAINNFLSRAECYAVCMKEDGIAIGSIELKLNGYTDMTDRDDECELGYCLKKEFWGRGIMPEAVKEILRHAFEDLGMSKIWCGYYDGNIKSKRVQEKCGFKFHHTCNDVDVPLLNEVRVGHTNVITKEEWEQTNKKEKLVIYIHGKGGNAAESNHYRHLFPDCRVLGLDYKSNTPWDAEKEFGEFFDKATRDYKSVILVANSIGAYFSLCSLNEKHIEKAYFISPIVNMEALIYGMMSAEGVGEKELEIKKEIPTALGDTLSWEYFEYAKTHPAVWKAPTHILYGENDNLQSFETVKEFANKTNATLTIMENGEHWFHTEEQMRFLDEWIAKNGK